MIGREKYTLVDPIFTKIGENSQNLIEGFWDCVKDFDPHLRKQLLNNIYLTGGNTLVPNF